MAMEESLGLRLLFRGLAEDKAADKAIDKKEEKIYARRAKFLSDPSKTQNYIAKLMSYHIPPEAEKVTGRATALENVEAMIPEDDPRRGMGTQLLGDYNKLVSDERLRGFAPEELINAAYMKRFGEKKEAIHEHSWKLRHGYKLTPKFKTNIREIPGQEEWDVAKPRAEYMSATGAAAVGGGFRAAILGAGKLFVKKGIFPRLAPRMIGRALPGPLKIAGAAAMAIPEFLAFDLAKNAVRNTKWAEEHPSMRIIAELAAGAGALGLTQKILSKTINKVFLKLANSSITKKTAEEAVAASPTAENLADLGKASREAGAAEAELEIILSGNESGVKAVLDDIVKSKKSSLLGEDFYSLLEGTRGVAKKDVAAGEGFITYPKLEEVKRIGFQRKLPAPLKKGIEKESLKLGPKSKFVTYSFKDIENIDEVTRLISKGKAPRDALQEIGEKEAVIKSVSEKETPLPIGNKIKKGLTQIWMRDLFKKGYVESDLENITAPAAKALVKVPEKNIRVKQAEDSIKKIVIKEAKIPQTKDRMAELADMSPGERFDLYEVGKISEKEMNIFNKKLRGEIEKGEEYLAYTKELEEIDLQAITDLVESSPIESLSRLDMLKAASGKLKGKEKAIKKIIPGIAAASTLIPLSDVLSPKEADAAGFEQVGGRVITKLAAKLIESASKVEVPQMIKAVKEAQLLPGPRINPFLDPTPMKQLKILPSLETLQMKKDLNPFLQGLGTPFAVAQYYFGVSKEGLSTFTNPMVQWASGQTAAIVNTRNSMETFLNIKNAIPDYTSSTRTVIDTMAPIVKKYTAPMAERNYAQATMRYYKKAMEKSLKNAGKKKGKAKETELASVEVFKKHMEKYDKVFKDSEEMYAGYQKDWVGTVEPLAAKHAGVRLFLAAEDTAEYEIYPFLKNMLTFDEKVTAARLKQMMEGYSERVTEVGGKIITHRPYMHHSAHPQANFKEMEKRIQNLNAFTDYPPPMAKLHSRAFNTLPMVPDVEYSMAKYLPDVNLRIEVMDFWRKGKPNGWYAFSKKAVAVTRSDGMRKFFEAFAEGFKPFHKENIDTFIERLYGLEVLRLLSLSPSVTFKHGLKTVADLRIFGYEGAKSYGEAAGSFTRLELERLGGPEALKTAGISLNVMDDAVKGFTEQGNLWRTISDISPFAIPETGWDKMMGHLNKLGSYPVASIERFDRGLSTIASLKMASKRGMTPAQAAYSVYDTILRTNFLSGTLNPAWLRNPKIRLFLIFQGTPFKLLQHRAMTYSRGTKSIVKAGRVALDELKALKMDVKEGEHMFKWELIKNALLSEKDLFGTPLVRQMMREILIVGSVVTTGRFVLDADLLHHFIHPPFVNFRKKEISIGASPVVSSTYKTLRSWMDKEEEDQEFILSTFFQEWFSKASHGVPIPANFVKAWRLTQDDIPKRYRGSEFKYIFGIPSYKGHK